MRIYFALFASSICFFVSLADAQDRSLPTTEQFQSALTTCAAGSGIKLDGELRGSFASIYNDKITEAKEFSVITSADFLNSLPPEDKLEGMKLYHTCVLAILNGKDVSQKETPDVIDLPSVMVTEGRPALIQAKSLFANNAEIRAFGSSSRGENGQPGDSGANGGNGANGSGGAGGNGDPGGDGGNGGGGASASEIRLEAETFTGQLKIINSGMAGGVGGNGGNGGHGGAGGSGGNGVSGAFSCRSGPGNGGSGGNAGPGGSGGRGGQAGNGGPVILRFGQVTPGSSITVVTDAGVPGEAGSVGQAGSAGRGGPRGSAPGLCSSGGRGPGADGVPATAGQQLGSGASGTSGQIEVTIGNKTEITSGNYTRSF